MSSYRAIPQQVPCDHCGRMLTVICAEPRVVPQEASDTGEVLTVVPLAHAWAEADWRCSACVSRTLHPSQR